MTDRSYLRVRWLHRFRDEPVDLWSELDGRRNEICKVEVWADGRMGYASIAQEVGGTALGLVPTPSLDEINRDPQFHAEAITRLDFEACWTHALRRV